MKGNEKKSSAYARKNILLDAILLLLMITLALSGGTDWHEFIGYLVVLLLVVHITWHWRQLVTMFRLTFPKAKTQRNIIFTLLILITTVTLFTFLYSSEDDDEDRFHGMEINYSEHANND